MATTLATESRAGRGKNVARRLRSSGRIPAVVYGDTGFGESPIGVAYVEDTQCVERAATFVIGYTSL